MESQNISFLFDGLYLTTNSDVAFSQCLQQHSTRSLVIVKNRLSSRYVLVQNHLSSMVGQLSKLGILLGILAAPIALFNQEYHQITIHVAVVFFVFYLISFLSKF